MALFYFQCDYIIKMGIWLNICEFYAFLRLDLEVFIYFKYLLGSIFARLGETFYQAPIFNKSLLGKVK